ncbi:MAG: glycerol kinase GlpK [Planctomycetes bacterium]|nr:glycerol kinase GlpK [Planctomycetota bacterium]
MNKDKVVISIDAGTTGIRTMAFRKNGTVSAKSYSEFSQIYPQPGWVEHNPIEIWNVAKKTIQDVIEQVGIENIVSIGITNQRETTVVWNKDTGKSLYNAIVWQCRRTTPLCNKLSEYQDIVKEKTGLVLDPYFSATKIKWLIDNVDAVKRHLKKGNLLFGTVDSWVIWNLTGGKIHATEPSNASRTLCYNIRDLKYDTELLKIFGLKLEIFPDVKDSNSCFGYTNNKITGKDIPIIGVLGDQQASLFAHGGWEDGVVKNTYGTGLFIMHSTGDKIAKTKNLVSTVAWKVDRKATYAVEGAVFVAGTCIQWLRDNLKIISSAKETESMAKSISFNEGVYFVPALAGLGTPYWDPTARGMIIGITRQTTPSHIARAALESMAYQTKDVIEEIKKSVHGSQFKVLRVDGGATKNNFLMQFQADILGMKIERAALTEATALGAAAISGISSGFWNRKEFLKIRKPDNKFEPAMSKTESNKYYLKWKDAVQRSLEWSTL